MSGPNDGGPAFPRPETEWQEGEIGMSLRDWFAGQALAGLFAAGFRNSEAAEMAYDLADRMLIERAKGA